MQTSPARLRELANKVTYATPHDLAALPEVADALREYANVLNACGGMDIELYPESPLPEPCVSVYYANQGRNFTAASLQEAVRELINRGGIND